MASDASCSCGCGDTVKTCKCSKSCSCKQPGGSCYQAEKAAQLGLWDRIRAKKERGGKPAQPGDKDYPDAKSWKKVTKLNQKTAGQPNTQPNPQPAAPMRNAFLDQFVPSWQARVKKVAPAMDKLLQPKAQPAQSQPAVVQPAAQVVKKGSSPAWQRAEGKNDEGGLNAKGRASYNKATGGNLKAPVTESNPKGDRAKRQNSFCARMCGMKKHETGAKTKSDPDSRINKSLRKWNCKCSSALEFGKLAANSTVPVAGLADPSAAAAPIQNAAALAGAIGLLAPTALGGVAGALTSRKGKRLAGAARGAGIGAAYTAGSSAGSALGGALTDNSGLARLGGGLSGGLGSALLAANLLPEIEEEKSAMQDTLFTFGAKIAKSMCSPCDMPNGPTNKKHMTGASPAVLDASEQSEELGRPEAEHTEHSEEAVNIPGAESKVAYLFGKKLAAYMTLDDSRGARQLAFAADRSRAEQARKERARSGLMANLPTAAEAEQARKERARSGLMANLPTAAETAQQNAARSRLGLAAHFPEKPFPPASRWSDVAPKAQPTAKPATPAPAAVTPAAVAPVAAAAAPVAAAAAPVMAAAAAPETAAAPVMAAMGPAAAAPGPKARALADIQQDIVKDIPMSPSAYVSGMKVTDPPAPKADGSWTEWAGNNAGYLAGGLGAAGLAALAYQLMNQKKKKRRPDDEE